MDPQRLLQRFCSLFLGTNIVPQTGHSIGSGGILACAFICAAFFARSRFALLLQSSLQYFLVLEVVVNGFPQ
jgi:hypothetical protein